MLIRKVHIKDIKNYTDQEFDFEAGVTAICGPNGAGKTTIIESIAWVLFDHLDYKREDFVRKGARKGTVSVTFVSKIDGRDYLVSRDTTGNYFAYDPVLQARLAQQKQDVIKWLCQQHGVEIGTDLSILFRTTIGVPQGTFTFDFLQAPSKRKPVFDKILKVEDYIKASDELKELIRLIERRIATIREQIASDEGELKRYDELVATRATERERLAELRLQCEEARLERQVAEVKVAQLDNAKNRLDRINGQLQGLELTFAHKTEREKSLNADLARAEQAGNLIAAARAGYETYQNASRQLQELERERVQRDERRAACTAAEQQQTRLEFDLKHRQEALKQIEQARVELATLTPRLSEQEALEQQLRELQRKLGEKDQVDRNLSKLGRELDELRVKYSEISKGIDEAERHKDAAALVTRLTDEQRELEEQARSRAITLNEIKNKEEQLANAQTAVEKYQRESTALAARVKELKRESRYNGPALAQLEASYTQMTNEAAQAKAIIERDENMLREIKDGLCPLLAQRCLNIKDGETLDGRFQFQLDDYRSRLQTSETALVKLNTQLGQARALVSKQATLDSLNTQLESLRGELAGHEQQQQRLKQELTELGDSAALKESARAAETRLRALTAELAEARDGMIKYAQLEPRRVRLNELKEEGIQRRKVYDAEKARHTALVREIGAQPEIESQLLHLGNPRATIESLNRQVAREPQLREEITELDFRYRELSQQVAALQAELAEWAQLDVELARINNLLNESRNDYDSFITNQEQAANLPTLKSEMASLLTELATLKQERERCQADAATAAANYSADEHSQARLRLEELIHRAARLESEFKYTETYEAQLTAQVEALEDVRRRQADKIANRDRLGELEELADFIRECLRKAGPYITEAYLHTISLEANQLYREISGNSLVALRWDTDYEIILEEEGRDRPFNNLSGGEQMAAALSVRLALLKEFSDLRFAFFDEPTTNMDEERRRNLAQQIGRIKDFEQLFVVSHDDSFEGFTDRVIQLKK